MPFNSKSLTPYTNLLEELKKLSSEAKSKIIDDTTDPFIINNVNFFTKSFMVTLCIYLESFLKDISVEMVEEINKRLAIAKIPHNIARWSILKKGKLHEIADTDYLYEELAIKINRKEIDDFISASPHKMENLFKKFGLIIFSDTSCLDLRNIIQSIVTKRNNIIHHNDCASDLSFDDISNYIDIVKEYIKNITSVVNNHMS